MAMKIRFWGTRGSVAVPGPSTLKYGGNTSCVEVCTDGGTEIIFDAGTGIRALGLSLMDTPFGEGRGEGHILLSHTHWDHINGFPFFLPAFIKGNRFTIYGGRHSDKRLEEILAGQMEHSYFPVLLEDMEAEIKYVELQNDQSFAMGDAEVKAKYLNHPGGSFGYRLNVGGRSFVYATDAEPYHRPLNRGGVNLRGQEQDEIDRKVSDLIADLEGETIDFVRGADILVHDCQYTAEEYESKVGWGHSTYDDAIRIASAGDAKHLIAFHHDPARSDEDLDRIVEEYRDALAGRGESLIFSAAYEGWEIDI
ncbi:MAG: MBL fold metallo-hydrolase [bacterium]